jgi:hypothetical protein
LFIVVAFSIISANSFSQPNNANLVEQTATIKVIINPGVFIIENSLSGLIYTVEKAHGAFIELSPGDVISYRVVVTPNGREVFIQINNVQKIN